MNECNRTHIELFPINLISYNINLYDGVYNINNLYRENEPKTSPKMLGLH